MAKKKSSKTPEKMVCAYCGKVKDQIIFAIGYSNTPEWTMNFGTGKISCPDCREKALEDRSKVEGKLKV